jgi:hypothetical protein
MDGGSPQVGMRTATDGLVSTRTWLGRGARRLQLLKMASNIDPAVKRFAPRSGMVSHASSWRMDTTIQGRYQRVASTKATADRRSKTEGTAKEGLGGPEGWRRVSVPGRLHCATPRRGVTVLCVEVRT